MFYSHAKLPAERYAPDKVSGSDERDTDKYPPRCVIEVLRFLANIINKVFWSIRYYGLENIPDGFTEGILITANHQTYIDPVWICPPVPSHKFRFMAYDKAFTWRLVGPLISYLGAFPVSSKIGETAAAIEESLQALRHGATLIIFPEGEREFGDAKMLPFKTGAVRLAMRCGVPILPVTINGGNRIWPHEQRFPKLFRRVKVIYHPLLYPKADPNLDFHRNVTILSAQLREIIANGMENGR
jgi:1-acyl-sn-glycerol-3-phosphate acyltransferase